VGLDMYLNARRFLWTGWKDHCEPDDDIADAIRAAMPDMGDMLPKYVIAEAAYWRKDNHIHKWFVDNVQNGNDDCGDYYVSREQLTQLANLCDQVLGNRSRAKELLPTQAGFFFSGTEYDEYYYKSLEYTRDRLRQLTAKGSFPKWVFYYHSSW